MTATAEALAAYVFAGTDRGIQVAGESGPVRRFRQLVRSMAAVVRPG